MSIKQLIDTCLQDLQDPKGVRWTRTELLGYFNEAQRQLATLRPDQVAVSMEIDLEPGYKQRLPGNVLALLDITHNVSRTARRITKTMAWQLDVLQPTWRSMQPALEALHFMYDIRLPLDFTVYPPVRIGAKVGASVAVAPNEATDETSKPGVPATWMDTLRNYVLFRAYSKDAEYGGNTQLASAALQLFNNALGVQAQAAQQVAPTS